jgi:2-succinyl-5-enolpyruvyl-6-hydroxy-3-cyclohexene-1-carboxylate synthase
MTAPNPSWAKALVIIDELVRNGVDRLILSPGSRSGALAMAAAADSRLQTTVAIDERSAGFWAVGFAKASGRPAAVLTTSGTAVANLLPAVVEASESLTPLILLTADRPFDLRHTGSNQTIDQNGIFGGYVRFFDDLDVARDAPGESGEWRSTVCLAVAAAYNGPAHLNLGFDEPLVPASNDGRDSAPAYRNDLSGRHADEPWLKPISNVAASPHFELSEGDLVVAGGGADLDLVLQILAAKVPVIAETHSGCRLPGTISTAHHLLSGGFPELEPRRLILLGRAGLSRPLSLLTRRVPTVYIEARGGDPSRRRLPLVRAGEFVAPEHDGAFARTWLEYDAIARSVLDRELDSQGLTEPRLARDLWLSLPPGAMLAVGSSMPVRDLDWFAPPRVGIKVVSNRGASGIDGFLSMALGASAAEQPAYGLVGDVSFLHDQNGLLIDPRAPLSLVVVNNRGGGVFSFLPQAGYPDFERVFATPHHVDLERLLAAHGIGYLRIESVKSLVAFTAEMPKDLTVAEIVTERGANVLHHRQLTEAVVDEVRSNSALRALPPA